jgi:hypothetical protein
MRLSCRCAAISFFNLDGRRLSSVIGGLERATSYEPNNTTLSLNGHRPLNTKIRDESISTVV